MDIDTAWDFSDPAASEARFRLIIAETNTQIARTLGLQRKFEEGHQVLDAVVATTPRLEVRLLLERGRLFNSAGEVAQARLLFIEAYEIGLQAKEEALAVDAAHMVAITESGEVAKEWNEKALAMAAGSEDPKARKWRASLLNNLGWTYHDEGDFERALEFFQEARHCREEMGQVQQERVARWCIARTLRSLGRFEEALIMQRLLLEDHREGDTSEGFVEEEIGENLLAMGWPEAADFFAIAHQKLSVHLGHDPAQAARLARLEDLGAAPE